MVLDKNKELKVNAIKNGTVLDHIPSENLFKVISILKLNTVSNPITFGMNLESARIGIKAIIKVSDMFFEDAEINKISLVAPMAKLNIIKNYEVVEKHEVSIPKEVIGIVRCFNPQCITNHQAIITNFTVYEEQPVSLRCHYCEKITTEEQMWIL